MSITATLTASDRTGQIDGVRLVVDGLPAITKGTPKQIAWAARIRDAALVQVERGMSLHIAAVVRTPAGAAVPAAKHQASLDASIAKLSGILDVLVDAAWWIDNEAALSGSQTVMATLGRGAKSQN